MLIHSPRETTTLVLDAAAFDAEDGRLPDSSIAWSSSIDGSRGAGATLEVETTDLAEGTHTLTAATTDGSSTTGTASVTVTIRRHNTAPITTDDIVVAKAGRTVTADVLANDRDPDGDIDGSSMMTVVPPAAGSAEATRVDGTGNVIRYGPAGRGYDALIYSVCDGSGQCATGGALRCRARRWLSDAARLVSIESCRSRC